MKHIKLFEEFITEGQHGMAKKLLNSLIKGETSSVEGIKMSKELAQHYLQWIETSPYGKKNGGLPLEMLVKASFNWGIERGLDPKLKGELKDLQGKITESLNESHFSVGDKVRCLKSGMTGEVISLDDPAETPDAKYCNVKREDGETMKYAPEELELAESTNEAIDTNYWADYHEKATKITSLSKVARAVEDAVEEWNDNNEDGEDNEVSKSGEKKVMKLAQEFFKSAGWISKDVIDAMITQES